MSLQELIENNEPKQKIYQYIINNPQINLDLYNSYKDIGELKSLKLALTPHNVLLKDLNIDYTCEGSYKKPDYSLSTSLNISSFWQICSYLFSKGNINLIEYFLPLLNAKVNNMAIGYNQTYYQNTYSVAKLINIAASKGNLNVIKYAIDKKWTLDPSIFGSVLRSHQSHILKYLLESGYVSIQNNYYVSSDIFSNHSGISDDKQDDDILDTLKLLTANGWKCSHGMHAHYCVAYKATCSNRFKCLQYAKSIGCPLTADMLYQSVCVNKDLTITKYLIENGVKITDSVLRNAVNNNNLTALKYFDENKTITWYPHLLSTAARSYLADLKMFKYLIEDKKIFLNSDAIKALINKVISDPTISNLEVLMYFYKKSKKEDLQFYDMNLISSISVKLNCYTVQSIMDLITKQLKNTYKSDQFNFSDEIENIEKN